MAAMLAGCPDDGTPVTTIGDTSSSEGGSEESNTNATVTQGTVDTTADTSGSDSSDTDVSTTRTTTDTDASSSSTDAESSSTDTGGPVCGDDVADRGEECDGTDLAGNDCVSEGFQGGTIACASDCTLDTSGCNNNCGNDVLDAGEDCDGAALGGEDCVSQGFDDGTLACDASCAFDTSACTMYTCGNDLIEGTEVCDGSDLAGQDCISQGFVGGTLGCAGNCGSFDTSQCDAVSDCCVGQAMGVTGCSDDTCEATVCGVDSFCCNNTWDGICANEAFDLCSDVCPPVCGDGNVTGSETCDGANFEGQDCVTQGFASGALACDAMCQIDTSGCVAAVCGNGIAEAGEQCDTPDLAGQDCVTQGFGAGTLACAADCTFDTSACTNAFCGNGVVEAGEACDGAAFNGSTCVTLGYNGPVESNCCDTGHGAGCDDAGCQGTICGFDPFCCNNTWDGICVDEAVDNCGTLCPGLACDADCGGFDASACDQALGACVEQDIGSATGAGVASGSTVGEDEDLAQGCASGGAVDHTIRFVAPSTGSYTIDLLGSSYDTALSLHTGCGAAFACNDDSQGTFQSTLIVDMVEGQAVTIAVSGYSGSTGNWVLNITPPTPPFPAVCDGGTDPGTGAPYVVCAADATSAWVSMANEGIGGNYHPVLICQALGYDDVGEWGGTCGNVCGYCEGATACDANGAATFDAGAWTGLGNCTADGLGEVLCTTVQWTCI